MPKKLNLFCGDKHKDKAEWFNIDILNPCDIKCHIGKDKLPFDDNSIDIIEADNGMEHLDDDHFMFAMNDIHRVLKLDGFFWIRVPDAENWFAGAFGDPTHKRFLCLRSFDYWEKGHQLYEVHGKSYGFLPWKTIELSTDKEFIIWKGSPYK